MEKKSNVMRNLTILGSALVVLSISFVLLAWDFAPNTNISSIKTVFYHIKAIYLFILWASFIFATVLICKEKET